MGRERVLITGAARGIGFAVAHRVLRDGGSATLLDHDEAALERARAALAEAGVVGRAILVRADVGDEEQVAGAVARAADAMGGLDGLVNNAGIGAWLPPTELPLATWQRVLTTNLTGAFLCSRHAAPFLARAHGAIVNVASTRALMSEPHGEAYAASKGGLLALTHALAASLAPDVRVNAVSPGWIDTRGAPGEPEPPPLRPEDHAQHLVGRVGRATDVAAAVTWLLSDEAGFATGQNVVLDGGMTRTMIYQP